MISAHIVSPSSATRSAGTPRSRRPISSGIHRPGTLPCMYSSARSERTGPTPARILQRRSSPRSRTSAIQRANAGTSKTNCVCANSAPAVTFLPSLAARKPAGGANGFSTAPMSQRGGGSSVRPDSSRPSSRMVRAVHTSWTLSRSNTGLASGWSPNRGWSPVIRTTLGMPRAAADSRSDWSAMRLRSRQVTCMTGSTPAARARRLPAQLDSRACAPWPSVMLTASTQPRSGSTLRRTASGSAPRGGPTSAVTVAWADSRLLRSEDGGEVIAAPSPGRRRWPTGRRPARSSS